MRPSFFTSTCTNSPGRAISMRRMGARVARSRWSKRLSPWRTSTACTVEAGMRTMPAMRAGPRPRFRRSHRMRRSRDALVRVGQRRGRLERSSSPARPSAW
jgi:hypothetical protein